MAEFGLRAGELSHLRWKDFAFDRAASRVKYFTHLVKKPGRTVEQYTSGGVRFIVECEDNKYARKIVRSAYASDVILGYARLHPMYSGGKVFAWSNKCAIQEVFKKWRALAKKGDARLAFLLDKCRDPLVGSKVVHRVHPHSLRRYAFTTAYYGWAKKDIVRLAAEYGHERVQTTADHYVKPVESLGVPDESYVQGKSFEVLAGVSVPSDQGDIGLFLQLREPLDDRFGSVHDGA